MKWIIYIAITFFVVILFTAVFMPHGKIVMNRKSASGKEGMTITSTAFKNNDRIPSKYTCDGQGINPPLSFSDIPKEAQSLVLLVEDPDAPGGTYHHWSIYNMPVSTAEISENAKDLPGQQGITDFGTAKYGGPCPPSGSHHYHFKLYALDTMLEVSDKATFNELEVAMQNHILATAELIGLYSRVN